MLASDGRHSTLGRETDPTEAELDQLVGQLDRAGLCAWLAIMDGNYYDEVEPDLLLVKALAGSEITWTTAVENFRRIRHLHIGSDRHDGELAWR